MDSWQLLTLEVRSKLCSVYGASLESERCVQTSLLRAIVKDHDDPDIEVTRWLVEKAAPLGINEMIQAVGVFLRVGNSPQGGDEDFGQLGTSRANTVATRKSRQKPMIVCARI